MKRFFGIIFFLFISPYVTANFDDKISLEISQFEFSLHHEEFTCIYMFESKDDVLISIHAFFTGSDRFKSLQLTKKRDVVYLKTDVSFFIELKPGISLFIDDKNEYIDLSHEMIGTNKKSARKNLINIFRSIKLNDQE